MSDPNGSGSRAAVLRARRRFIPYLAEITRFGVRQLMRHRAPEMAAALSYRTIFSLIPLLVLALITLRGFFGEAGIRTGLSHLLEYTGISQLEVVTAEAPPEGELAPPDVAAQEAWQESGSVTRLSVHIEDFVNRTVARLEKINFGVIAVFGAALLVYAAFSLLLQTEQAFNTIYRAPTSRRLIVRLTNYWVVVTAGVLALMGGFLLSERTATTLETLPDSLWWVVWPLNMLLRVGFTWIILLATYRLMPNARVALGPAAIGAAMAATLWELCKSGLGLFVSSMASPDSSSQYTVYGSLALIPLFFLWIYVTWILILGGLEVAFALQMVSTGRASALDQLDQRAMIDPSVGIVLMRIVAERFEEGATCTVEELAARTGLAEAVIERMMDHLARKGLLHRVERSAEEDAFALARPPSSVTAGAVLAAIHDLTAGLGGATTPESQRDAELLARIRSAEVSALAPLNLGSTPDR